MFGFGANLGMAEVAGGRVAGWGRSFAVLAAQPWWADVMPGSGLGFMLSFGSCEEVRGHLSSVAYAAPPQPQRGPLFVMQRLRITFLNYGLITEKNKWLCTDH